jgi:hypothetical protein
MPIDRERIDAHAQRRLRGGAEPADAGGRLSHLNRFLKLETDRLRVRHRFGLGGLEIASARSHQVDQVVSQACRLALDESVREARIALAGCAVVALGGYGCGELTPFSDVDLLLLHQGRGSVETEIAGLDLPEMGALGYPEFALTVGPPRPARWGHRPREGDEAREGVIRRRAVGRGARPRCPDRYQGVRS